MNEKQNNDEGQPPSGIIGKLKRYFRNPFFIKTQSVSEVTDFLKDAADQKIIDKEIPADIIYEDEKSLVFKDINPVAPTHILIIPKKQIEKISDAEETDQDLLGHLLIVAGKVARQLGVENAFRLVVNNGAGAQQTVFHLHIHLIAEREFSWPPG